MTLSNYQYSNSQMYNTDIKRKVFTIFYDTGKYLWVKDAEDETMYVGQHLSDCAVLIDDYTLSQFTQDLALPWLKTLSATHNCCINDENIDWTTAHHQGIQLAKALKAD